MSLIAHFKLNGNTVDAIGTYSSNTPTAITYTSSGKLDSAAIFNGSSSAILLSSTINLEGNANWTVSVWVKTTSTARMSILSNSSGGPVMNDICIEGGKIAYYHYNATWLFKQGTISINDGLWHNLIWVNFVGNKMNMYVDGVLDQSQVDSTQPNGPVNQIGKNWGSAYFNGTLDDFRIYNDALLDKITDLNFARKMIGHWPLNGNTNDYSGYNNNGTPTNLTYSDGKIGQAGTFNGTAYINCGNNSLFIAPSITLGGWLKLSNTGSWMMFNRGNSGNIGAYYLYGDNNTAIKWSVFGPTGTRYDAIFNTTLTTGVWYHIVAVYDSTNTQMRIYLNGSLVQTTGDAVLGNANYVLYLGSYAGGGSYLLNGQLNDARIYNYALSEYEIKELAKAKILHYTFDDPNEEPTTNIHNDPVLKVAFVADQAVPKSNWGVDGTIFARVSTSPIKKPGDLMLEINITSGSSGGLYTDLSLNAPSTTYTLVEGKTYTRSWWMKCSDTRTISGHVCSSNRGSDNLYKVGSDIAVSPIWQRYSHTFTVATGEGGSYHTRHIIYDYIFSVWITNIQIEEKASASEFTIGTRNIGISDISGYNNRGTVFLANAPSYITGKIGSGSLKLNGINNFVRTGSTGSDQFTISVWFKPYTSSTTQRIYWGTGTNKAILALNGSNLQWYMQTSTTAVGYKTTVLTYNLNQWNHAVLTYNGSLAVCYINGSADSNTGAITGYSTASQINLGTNYSSSDNFFGGELDDFRIYATALSATDILAIYNKRANLDNLGNVQVNEFQEDKNLTPNPSFDIDSPGTIVPTGWTLEVGGTPQVVDIDGRRAVLFLGDGAYRRLRSTKYFSVTPGQTIYGKLWAKRMTGSLFYFGLYWGTGYDYFTSGGGDNVWSSASGSLVIPAGVTEVAVWIFNYSGNTGALYIDDIFVSYDPIETNFADNMSKTYTDKYRLYPTGINMALEYDEITGTANASAQQEISKNGSLIINGEFSEIDL